MRTFARDSRPASAAATSCPCSRPPGRRCWGVAPFLDAVTDYFPSPRDAKAEATDAAGNAVELVADPAAPLAAQVFKTTADQYVGKLTYLRVFSGTLRADSQVWNANHGVNERIGQLFVVRGKAQEPTATLVAGDIGAVAKLAETVTSDTLTTRENALKLPPIHFPRADLPCRRLPKSKADTEKMSSALSRIAEEDPILRVEREADTGETILAGLGESHIEIACEKMKRKFGAEVLVQTPRVRVQGDPPGPIDVGAHAQEADGRPRPVREGHAADRATAARLRFRVRE